MEFGTVDLTDWLTLGALILGPLFAVFWSQKMANNVRHENNLRDEQVRKEANLRDEKLEKKNRQIAVFRTLWANRSHADHSIFLRFEAINLVPFVFHKNEAICDDWRSYIDASNVKPFGWNEDLIVQKVYLDLLKNIADYLGYKFTNDDLKRDFFPNANQKKSDREAFIREGLFNLFCGDDGKPSEKPLPIAVK